MYSQDSFFTLAILGQIGLLALSGTMFASLVWIVLRLGGSRVARITIALVMFHTFIWIAPQIFYAYYYLIFESLPLQIVIGWPPSPFELLQLLTFSASQTLAAHAQGLLGWATIIASQTTRKSA